MINDDLVETRPNDAIARIERWLEGQEDTMLAADVRSIVTGVNNLRQVCACAYQLAGVVGAPVRFLDALSDASNGEIGLRSPIDELLPVRLDECDEFKALNPVHPQDSQSAK